MKNIENLIFKYRIAIILLFMSVTFFFAISASHIQFDSGYAKNLPTKHEYIKTYLKHQKLFGGANRLMIAIENKKGDIFNPDFFKIINNVTDELFFIPGVDRSQVTSIFTPNTTFREVVEDGFAGGPVVPADFQYTREGVNKVRRNILKAGIVGQLVSKDFTSAMVTAQLLETDPETQKPLDYIKFADSLEKQIREKHQTKDVKIHIIGFAKVVGDIVDGLKGVLLFFSITIMITFILVFFYCRSFKLTIVSISSAMAAVVWQLGLITVLGFGLDPMSILVPFLIFAIGVSHGMQMINAMSQNIARHGLSPEESARASFRSLIMPGSVALFSDTVGFLTLLLIEIVVVKELAITASLGVASILLINMFLLPLIMSFLTFDSLYREKIKKSIGIQNKFWNVISRLADPGTGTFLIMAAVCLAVFGAIHARNMKVGELHEGAAALHSDSRYNKDTSFITSRFSIGTDIITVITETSPDACIRYDVMEKIDRFEWYMENVEGVVSAISLPHVAKIINSGFNEGNHKWHFLPRNSQLLVQATKLVPISSGLLNSDCSVMPVYIFTTDHKAETIEKIVSKVKSYIADHPDNILQFKLATGQVGVMAATNESVKAAQIPMLLWVYSVVSFLCLISFRSIRGTLSVILPLALVSILAQALMTFVNIGLTVNTLPVIALGVGIGVDYGIYIITPMLTNLKNGKNIRETYFEALKTNGSAVFFTGIILSAGVMTWIFSSLKFQMDMGILLSFMFLLNMIGSIVLLPAIASVLFKEAGGKWE